MSEKTLPVGGKKMAALRDAVQALLDAQPESVREHSDRVACITRFLCAQYTRTHGSKTIPVKELPVIYAGAALHDMPVDDVMAAVGVCGLTPRHNGVIEEICRNHHHSRLLKGPADAAMLYTQIVALAECYEMLTMSCGEKRSHAQAME